LFGSFTSHDMNSWITKSSAGGGLLLLAAAGAMLCLHSRDDDGARADGRTKDARISTAGEGGSQESVASIAEGKSAPASLSAPGEGHGFSNKASSSGGQGPSAAAVQQSSTDDDSRAAPLARTKVRDRPADGAVHSAGARSNRTRTAAEAGAHSAAVMASGAPPKETADQLAKADASSKEEASAPTPDKVNPAELPVVYQLSDEELLAHSPGVQPEVLEPIRDQFERDAGVGKLDTADPEYARRWNIASPSADDRYRTLFGWAAYGDMARRAAAARAAQAAAATPQQ
jgi:hypothetical protein